MAIFEKCNIEMRRIDTRLSHTRQITDTPGFKQFTKQQFFFKDYIYPDKHTRQTTGSTDFNSFAKQQCF